MAERKTPAAVREKIFLASKESRRISVVFLIVLLILFIISTGFTRFNPLAALIAQGEFWNFVLTDFVPPYMGKWAALSQAVLQTVCMALSATGIAAVLSLGLSFLGTKTIVRSPVVNGLVRGFASILRNIPDLVWAFILVAAFGIGTVVGVLALIISNIGQLTRFFIETLDEAAEENMEGVLSAGASMPQVISQAILPSALPGLIAWLLYSVELNLRSSTILGMVGAGGIGILIQRDLNLRNFPEVTALVVILLSLVLLTELTVNVARRRLNRQA